MLFWLDFLCDNLVHPCNTPVPVPEVAAIDADDDRVLPDLPLPTIGRSVLDATRSPVTKVGFVPGGDLVQVAANSAGIGGAADRQDLFQQLGSQAEGDQRGPSGL
jgi:hypothetical protein